MPTYTITELAVPLGAGPNNNTYAWDISDKGNIAGGWGAVSSAPMNLRAVQWDGNMPHLIGMSSAEAAGATAINDTGQVTGWHNYFNAFLYSGGQVRDLSAALGPGLSYAADINGSGVVVGYGGGGLRAERAFVYDPRGGGQPIMLDPLPGHDVSAGYAINEAGQIAGVSASTETGSKHVFLFENRKMRDLGPGYMVARLNDEGIITGSIINISGELTAFRLASSAVNPVVEELPPFPSQSASWGFGINNDGVVVGQYSNAQSDVRAFVSFPPSSSTPGSFALQDLVTNAGDWILTSAYAINNGGQIVGLGVHQGEANQQTRALLLTPELYLGLDRIEGLLAGFLLILGGATQGGPGTGIPFSGRPIPIPPHEPLVSAWKQLLPRWNGLSQPERDLLVSTVVSELTLMTDDPVNRRLLEQAGRAIAERAIGQLGK